MMNPKCKECIYYRVDIIMDHPTDKTKASESERCELYLNFKDNCKSFKTSREIIKKSKGCGIK